MRKQNSFHIALGLGLLSFALTGFGHDDTDAFYREAFDQSVRDSPIIDFPQTIGSKGDPVNGRRTFGLAANTDDIDTSLALFQGQSQLAGNVVSNGKVCASCHRPAFQFGLPNAKLSTVFPSSDPMFDQSPEAGQDPLRNSLFDNNALVMSRFGRFNPFISESDPFREVFAWRKSMHILNLPLTYGYNADGRARNLIEQARGAVFNHTQSGDERFDDIVNAPNLTSQRLTDIAAFEESLIDPPALKALLNPNDPNYAGLVADPFKTVSVVTKQQQRGEQVFIKYCMGCHNMPNVFSNTDHRDNPPLNTPLPAGHTMDVGVAQRNALHLEVRRWDVVTKTRIPIVVPLVKIDGTVVQWTVTDDIGLAANTGRYEDLHRFKVPQLRDISQLAPYFHDNSAATLGDVVDYFGSDDYNRSADGAQHPIHYGWGERDDLLAFLQVL